ncbi:LLM class flavin-dependent oxidoreductase, partial [Rhodococcus hoagii]|nr:LLM class flavin-dependent oxidoreductase [Prescottella equi]
MFLPLVSAAGAVDADLITNVAIALPRSPMHLAHTGTTCRRSDRGRFRPRAGLSDRPHIESGRCRVSRPAARMREIVLAVKAIFDALEGNSRLRSRGSSPPTPDAAHVRPRPNPYGPPPICLGALGPVMTRTAAEVADGLLCHAVQQRSALPRAHAAGDRGGARPRRTPRRGSRDLPAGDRGNGRHPGRTGRCVARRAEPARLHGSTPAYRPVLDVEGWGDLQPELNALSKVGEYAAMAELIDDKMLTTLAVARTPEECAAEIVDRFGAYSDRVCCYFPATRFGTGTSPIS